MTIEPNEHAYGLPSVHGLHSLIVTVMVVSYRYVRHASLLSVWLTSLMLPLVLFVHSMSFFIRLISSTFIYSYHVFIEALIVGHAVLVSLISGILLQYVFQRRLFYVVRLVFGFNPIFTNTGSAIIHSLVSHSGDPYSSLIVIHHVPPIILTWFLILVTPFRHTCHSMSHL
jgi:hypothetical protein